MDVHRVEDLVNVRSAKPRIANPLGRERPRASRVSTARSYDPPGSSASMLEDNVTLSIKPTKRRVPATSVSFSSSYRAAAPAISSRIWWSSTTSSARRIAPSGGGAHVRVQAESHALKLQRSHRTVGLGMRHVVMRRHVRPSMSRWLETEFLPEQPLCDHHPLNLVGALVDLGARFRGSSWLLPVR